MKKYKIYRSERFDKELNKFDENFKKRVDKIEDQLVNNPYSGDSLNVYWFREKRYGKYRIYYIIYDDLESLIMVAISEKNDQQKVINTVKFLFHQFREEIEVLINKDNLT